MNDLIYSEYIPCKDQQAAGAPPILLLHGWGQSSDATRGLGSLLAAHSDVYLIDLPGFGRSPHPDSDWDTFDYARSLVEAMTQRGIPSATVIGHSFGGKVALSMAIAYPERVHALGLLATSGIRHALPLQQRLRSKIISQIGKIAKASDALIGLALYQQQFIPRFGSADYRAAGTMRGILVKTVNDDLTPYLHRVKCPTLLLWGDRDNDTPLAIGQQLHAAIPQSHLVTFPGKGHQLLHDVSSHLCASYLLPFCREVGQGAVKEKISGGVPGGVYV